MSNMYFPAPPNYPKPPISLSSAGFLSTHFRQAEEYCTESIQKFDYKCCIVLAILVVRVLENTLCERCIVGFRLEL